MPAMSCFLGCCLCTVVSSILRSLNRGSLCCLVELIYLCCASVIVLADQIWVCWLASCAQQDSVYGAQHQFYQDTVRQARSIAQCQRARRSHNRIHVKAMPENFSRPWTCLHSDRHFVPLQMHGHCAWICVPRRAVADDALVPWSMCA